MDLLSYQKGDILFSNCQTLVNPVSCDGTIDSYLSKRFFTRYWVYQGKTKNILNFPIKEISNLEPQPEVVKASFMRLAETYQDRNISSIAFPRIFEPNLFNDGAEIQKICNDFLSRLSIPTVVYTDYIPHSKTLIPLITQLVGVLSDEEKKVITERFCFEI